MNKIKIDNIEHTISLKEDGAAHEATICIDKVKLNLLMGQYWHNVKDKLNPQLVAEAMKGGFRELKKERVIAAAGGISEFYRHLMLDVVDLIMGKQSRGALVVSDVKLIEGISVYNIVAKVHLEPEVKWRDKIPGIDEPLKVGIPKMPINMAEQMADNEIARAQDKQALLTPVMEDTYPVEGQVVVVDINSTINGQVWEDGCSTSKKWPVEREFHKVPEIYEAILASKPGTVTDLSFKLGEYYGDMAGTQVDAKLRVVQAFTKTKAPIDDDLAKSNGFESLEHWRKTLIANGNYKIAESRVTLVDNEIASRLLNSEVVDVGPVPQVWMAEKAHELFEQTKQVVPSELDIVNQFKTAGLTTISGTPVDSKQSVLLFFAEKSAQQLVADLVFKSWGLKRGIVGDTSLEMLPDYVKAVSSELKAIVDVSEYDIKEGDM